MGTNVLSDALRDLRAAVLDERARRRDYMRGGASPGSPSAREAFAAYERAKIARQRTTVRAEQILVERPDLIGVVERLGPEGNASGGLPGSSRDGTGPSVRPRGGTFHEIATAECPYCHAPPGACCRDHCNAPPP